MSCTPSPYLHRTGSNSVSHRGLPSPLGLRAHVELSKISAYIVNNSYRHHANKPADGPDRLPFSVAIGKLDEWHENLPESLKLSNLEDSPSNYYYFALQPEAEDPLLGNDRALLSLHMAYNQVCVLLSRLARCLLIANVLLAHHPGHPSRVPHHRQEEGGQHLVDAWA